LKGEDEDALFARAMFRDYWLVEIKLADFGQWTGVTGVEGFGEGK